MPVIQAHFFYRHITFILYHASNVRFHIRYIIIHVQRYLTGGPALCSKYLNILFPEFHFLSSNLTETEPGHPGTLFSQRYMDKKVHRPALPP